MSSTRYHLVTVGIIGNVSADGLETWGDPPRVNRCSVSSYDGLAEFLTKHAAELEPGAPIVDLTPLADRSDIYRLAFDAPMCDPSLTDDRVDRWHGTDNDSDPLGIAPLLAGSYFGARGALAAMTTTTDRPGPFDHVSPWRLAAYWAELGATVTIWTPARGELEQVAQ